MTDDAIPRQSFTDKHRKVLLGLLAVAIFFAAWQAVFLFVPFNQLFVSKPDLICAALADLIASGDLMHDLAVSAVPFVYGFSAAVVVGVPLGVVMGWRERVALHARSADDRVLREPARRAGAAGDRVFRRRRLRQGASSSFCCRCSRSSSTPRPGCARSIRC